MKRILKKGIIVLTILGCIGSTTVMASEKNKVAVDKKKTNVNGILMRKVAL